MKKPITPTQRMLNMWAIILILWSVYRTYYGTELPIWFDEFVAKPLIFIFPLVVYIQKIEKKAFLASIDFKLQGIKSDVSIALLAGGTFILSGIAVYVMKNSTFPPFFLHLSLASALQVVLISFASSISEEILSRGFVLKRLYEESKNTFSSVFFASFLFFFLHIPIFFCRLW